MQKLLLVYYYTPNICQLNYQKVEVCVVNLLAAIFGDQRIEGFKRPSHGKLKLANSCWKTSKS